MVAIAVVTDRKAQAPTGSGSSTRPEHGGGGSTAWAESRPGSANRQHAGMPAHSAATLRRKGSPTCDGRHKDGEQAPGLDANARGDRAKEAEGQADADGRQQGHRLGALMCCGWGGRRRDEEAMDGRPVVACMHASARRRPSVRAMHPRTRPASTHAPAHRPGGRRGLGGRRHGCPRGCRHHGHRCRRPPPLPEHAGRLPLGGQGVPASIAARMPRMPWSGARCQGECSRGGAEERAHLEQGRRPATGAAAAARRQLDGIAMGRSPERTVQACIESCSGLQGLPSGEVAGAGSAAGSWGCSAELRCWLAASVQAPMAAMAHSKLSTRHHGAGSLGASDASCFDADRLQQWEHCLAACHRASNCALSRPTIDLQQL